MKIKNISNAILEYKDFPKQGVVFKDISPLFLDPKKIKFIIKKIAKKIKKIDFDLIIAPEARGFLFAVPLALKCKKPFVMVRKKGKLPGENISENYNSEYANCDIEIQSRLISPGQKVLIFDDIVATGNTNLVIEKMINKLNSQVVAHACLMEIKVPHQIDHKNKLSGKFIRLIKA